MDAGSFEVEKKKSYTSKARIMYKVGNGRRKHCIASSVIHHKDYL